MNYEKNFEPDHTHLIRKDLWKLTEACAAILNLRVDLVLASRKEFQSFRNMLDEARAAKPENLKIIINDEDQQEYVEAKAFISWAYTKGYRIPNQFQELLDHMNEKMESNSLRISRERNKIQNAKKKSLKILRAHRIKDSANKMFPNVQSIPENGKARIRELLHKTHPAIFPNKEAFNYGWKYLRKGGVVKMEKHEDYIIAK